MTPEDELTELATEQRYQQALQERTAYRALWEDALEGTGDQR